MQPPHILENHLFFSFLLLSPPVRVFVFTAVHPVHTLYEEEHCNFSHLHCNALSSFQPALRISVRGTV